MTRLHRAGRPLRATTAGKILLVDDNEADGWLLREAFQALEIEHSLQIVHDGDQALQVLGEEPHPVLILLDINMPKMNGFDVLKEIRADPKLRLIPVVIFTSSHHKRDVERAYELGANAYVAKPSNNFIDVIGDVLKFWLRRAELPGDTG